MKKKTFEEVARLWQEDKRLYVKRSTFAAYILLLDNHLIPSFGQERDVTELRIPAQCRPGIPVILGHLC